MRFGSLYSGIGGADYGLCLHGWVPVFQAECDVFRAAVLRRRFPQARLYDDVQAVCADESVDVIYAEMPDRDVPLWWPLAAAAIQRVRPSWIIVEFSPTVDMSPILRDVVAWGWGIRLFTLNARLDTPSLERADQHVSTRAMLVCAARREDMSSLTSAHSCHISVTAEGPLFDPALTPIERLELARALPAGWTCQCGQTACMCLPDARISAIRDATTPVISDTVAHLLSGLDLVA